MGKQLNFLKRLVVLQGTLALGLWLCASASASVIDAPHNDTNGIQCADCHAYSLWWKYSPAINSSTPYNQITDGVCNKCHAPGGSAPNKIAHKWESMADIHDGYLGTWETNCADCHNPHYQQQLSWLDTEPALSSNLYLATGTITAGSVSPNSTSNTTTLTYKNADAHLNWLNPALWAEKSVPGRGLILVILDTTQSTFEINATSETTAIINGTANGTGTITLQGQLPLSYNAADTNFAIIYGQLLKKSITTPNSGNKDVKFFDASISYDDNVIGGAADPVTSPAQGICQVCHTKTKYYTEDGLQPDRTTPTNPRYTTTPHNDSVPCIPCHSTSLGFRPTNADHTFISNLGTTCTSCHNEADIVSGTHTGDCTDCHLSPPALVTPFPSSKWPTAEGQPRATGNCYDCHSPIAAAFTAHPKANDHTGQVDASPNCVGCHFHSNKNVVNDIHGVDGSPCDTCHSLTYNAGNGTYSGNGALIGRAALNGNGECKKCHTEIANTFFMHPKSDDHSGQVISTPQCTAACHAGDPVADTHNWSCGTCHTSPTGLLKGSALTHGPGDCMNCHTNFYVHPSNIPHTTEVTAAATCAVCHAETNLINDLHGRLGCATCHDQYGTLQGSATGHSGGGNCIVCHTSQAAGPHPRVNHSDMEANTAYVSANAEGNCTDCHIGDTVDVVHNGNCLACHVGLSTDLIHTLKGSATGHEGHAVNTCTECHTTIATSFNKHKNAIIHDTQVTALGTPCFSCHDGADPIWDTHKLNCGNCHAADGRLIGTAAGKGTGKPPTTGNNCIDCHADPKYYIDPPNGALNH